MPHPVRRALQSLVLVLVSTVLPAAAEEQKPAFSIQEEYADAKQLADGIRQWEASPKRTLMLARFQALETEYLPRAQRHEQVTSAVRKALDQHKARESDFFAKLQAIKNRSAEDTGPGSAWRAELAQVAAAYSGYLKEWEPRRKELSAQLGAATAELEQSRAPLKEFQHLYHALYFRRVAYRPGMTWEQLVSAERLAFLVRRCYEATLLFMHSKTTPATSEGVPATPVATLYRTQDGEEWVRRKDLGVPGMEADAEAQPATVVCVREAEEIIGHYQGSSGMIRPAAVSVQWHVLLVRASDGAVLATKVLYGAPPPDTAAVLPTMVNKIRGKAPTPSDLAEWLNRRIGAAPRK